MYFDVTIVSFFYSSVGKESACNAGDPSSIPGSGRSTGEGIGYPLQYSWASLVAQLVKNPPAMRETWIRSLGWEDPLEQGKATHSSILTWTMGHKASDTIERLSLSGVSSNLTLLKNKKYSSYTCTPLQSSCLEDPMGQGAW